MKLVLIRHGEIDSNRAQVYSGRSDEPLNEVGRAQAHTVAERLRTMGVGALFSSPLRRTMETASIIGQQISLIPIVSESFNELRMGPWEGLSEAEIAARFPAEFAIWNSTPADLTLADRETLEELQLRALGGLFDIAKMAGNNPIVVVSHVAVIRVLILHAARRHLNDYKKIAIPNATPLVVSIDEGEITNE